MTNTHNQKGIGVSFTFLERTAIEMTMYPVVSATRALRQWLHDPEPDYDDLESTVKQLEAHLANVHWSFCQQML